MTAFDEALSNPRGVSMFLDRIDEQILHAEKKRGFAAVENDATGVVLWIRYINHLRMFRWALKRWALKRDDRRLVNASWARCELDIVDIGKHDPSDLSVDSCGQA